MRKKTIILFVIGMAVAGLAIWGFVAGRKELAQEQARERPISVPSRVVSGEAGTAVTFDPQTQKLADIGVAAVEQTTHRGETLALATVLSPQALTDLRNHFVAVTAQTDQAVAALAASRREYERLKSLHGDERNISDRALQAAEATWRSDQAAEQSAQAAVDAIQQTARQTWGTVLATAVADNTPLFRRLAAQQEVLLRIAAPSGSRLPVPPSQASVVGDDNAVITATLVSASPQADPRIQGTTFFYAAAAEGLLPGTTLTARLPVGPQETGVTIPAAAVVSWQGKAWYYVESTPGRFARHELTDAAPVAGGWFAPRLGAMQVVVRGAQTLLSEELRGQVPAGEEDED
jgi:hypothetical protein